MSRKLVSMTVMDYLCFLKSCYPFALLPQTIRYFFCSLYPSQALCQGAVLCVLCDSLSCCEGPLSDGPEEPSASSALHEAPGMFHPDSVSLDVCCYVLLIWLWMGVTHGRSSITLFRRKVSDSGHTKHCNWVTLKLVRLNHLHMTWWCIFDGQIITLKLIWV